MDISEAIQTRENRQAEVKDSLGSMTAIYGNIDFTSPGEIDRDITFSQHFTNIPFISVCMIRGSASPIVASRFPLIGNPVIAQWNEVEVENLVHYTGARLLLVIEGPPGTRGSIMWRAEGMTMTGSNVNPAE